MKWALSVICLVLAGCTIPLDVPLERTEAAPVTETPTQLNGTYRVIIPDVGQGGAALIQTPDGKTILYDCGRYKSRLYDDLAALNIETIDLLITSNPDADHIGACRDVLKDYPVLRVVDNGLDKDTLTSREYRELVNAHPHETLEGDRADSEFPFIHYLAAYDTATMNSINDNSVGMKLTLGETTFLFTGDCEKACEEELKDTADLDADVLYAGHHGSRTSSTSYALEEITPSVVLIAVGNNTYGHPHPDAIDRLNDYTDNIFTTQEEGMILVETRGTTLTVSNADGLLLWKR